MDETQLNKLIEDSEKRSSKFEQTRRNLRVGSTEELQAYAVQRYYEGLAEGIKLAMNKAK